MRIEGAIYPAATGFTRDAWCELVRERPEFRRRPPRQGTNPFTGELVTTPSREDTADVIQDGRVVGEVYWSMSDEPLVNVSVDPSAMSLVSGWAEALGGEFRPD